MKIVGITGPTGAGKSLLSEYLRENGIPVIDADRLYHSLLVPPSPCLDALKSAFGDGVFSESGELDRKKLAAIVFSDEKKLDLLNRTVLDFVLDRSREILADYESEGYAVAAIDAPTLIESGFHLECDTVVSVICDSNTRIQRIIERDGISPDAAKSRVSGQKSNEFYTKNSHVVIVNDKDEDEFFDCCRVLKDALLKGVEP